MKYKNILIVILVQNHKKPSKSGQHSKIGQAVKISQLAKICSCEKFVTLQNLCNAHSPSVFNTNCLLLCLCSFEFGLGSSHLNWLEDNGIIGLQNYKNIHKILLVV